MAAQWQLNDSSMAAQWQLHGSSMAAQWQLNGSSTAAQWHLNGSSMAAQWQLSFFLWHRQEEMDGDFASPPYTLVLFIENIISV